MGRQGEGRSRGAEEGKLEARAGSEGDGFLWGGPGAGGETQPGLRCRSWLPAGPGC